MQKRKIRVNLTPGQVVRELRLKKEWTQAILAESSGIDVSKISMIENNRRTFDKDEAARLSKALGLDPEFLLFPNKY